MVGGIGGESGGCGVTRAQADLDGLTRSRKGTVRRAEYPAEGGGRSRDDIAAGEFEMNSDPNTTVTLINAPKGFETTLGELPEGVKPDVKKYT
jgi:hypothetical protein